MLKLVKKEYSEEQKYVWNVVFILILVPLAGIIEGIIFGFKDIPRIIFAVAIIESVFVMFGSRLLEYSIVFEKRTINEA